MGVEQCAELEAAFCGRGRLRDLNKREHWKWKCAMNPGIQYLRAFSCIKRNMGILEFKKSYIDDSGYTLGCWVYNQRRRLPKIKNDAVRGDRIGKLSNIQLEGEMCNESWDTIFARLFLHQKEHGDT